MDITIGLGIGLLIGAILAFFIVNTLIRKSHGKRIEEANKLADKKIQESQQKANKVIEDAERKAKNIISKADRKNEEIKQKKIQQAKTRFRPL